MQLYKYIGIYIYRYILLSWYTSIGINSNPSIPFRTQEIRGCLTVPVPMVEKSKEGYASFSSFFLYSYFAMVVAMNLIATFWFPCLSV